MQARLLLVGALAALTAQNQPVLGEDTVKISEHVWAIMGWPNIAIIVGSRATLVVDTGLGPRNGATIARVAAKLSPGNQKLFLTTTHFHPEHAGGEAGFPSGTILIRNAIQQREMELHGREMIDLFAGRSAQFKDLLANAAQRTPDITFEQEAHLDLGGVLTDRVDFLLRDIDRVAFFGKNRKWHGWPRKDRGNHDGLGHHGEREASGETTYRAPTPGPPHSACALWARVRSQSTVRLERPAAQKLNSRWTQMPASMELMA